MRTTKNFKDYEILDCSGGEKLERWGDKILIRPDPQIIWNTERVHECWKKSDARYHRSNKGGGQWEYHKSLPKQWSVKYKDLKFLVKPTGFKHLGLFPEQAVNWDLTTDTIKSAGRPIKLLNLFAYTGGATLAAAAAGAQVCHVDAAKGMVAWARENAEVSGLSDAPIRWIVDDCYKFVQREQRRGVRYDAIIMDPPSYGRGPGGEMWKLEDNIYELVELCASVLSDNPLFFMLNSYTTGLSGGVMNYLLSSILHKKYGGTTSADEIGIPVVGSDFILPCGNTAFWQS